MNQYQFDMHFSQGLCNSSSIFKTTWCQTVELVLLELPHQFRYVGSSSEHETALADVDITVGSCPRKDTFDNQIISLTVKV